MEQSNDWQRDLRNAAIAIGWTVKGWRFTDGVRQGFLELAASEPDRIKVVEADRDVEAVWADIKACVDGFSDEKEGDHMPLRINSKSPNRTPSPLPESEPRLKIDSPQRTFAVDLSKESDQQVRQRLEELLGKIQQQGKRLGQTPTYSELKAYRELVKKFMSKRSVKCMMWSLVQVGTGGVGKKAIPW